MKTFTLQRTITIDRKLDEVFSFFSNASNLEELTPKWLRFRILTPTPITIKKDTIIDYQIRLWLFPMRWRSIISDWKPPHSFTDQQLKGPYKQWIHQHNFYADGESTRVEDIVSYTPRGGWIAQKLFVQRNLEQIFHFRHTQLQAIFPKTMT